MRSAACRTQSDRSIPKGWSLAALSYLPLTNLQIIWSLKLSRLPRKRRLKNRTRKLKNRQLKLLTMKKLLQKKFHQGREQVNLKKYKKKSMIKKIRKVMQQSLKIYKSKRKRKLRNRKLCSLLRKKLVIWSHRQLPRNPKSESLFTCL